MLNREQFSSLILRLRREKGWSQEELARRIGAKQESISHYECGRCFPGLRTSLKLAEVLGCKLEELCQ